MSQYNTNLPKVLVVAIIVILNMIKSDFFIPDLYYNPQYKFLPFSRLTRKQTLPSLHIQNVTHCLSSHLVLSSYTSSHRGQCSIFSVIPGWSIWLTYETSLSLTESNPTTAPHLQMLPLQFFFAFKGTFHSQKFMISSLGYFHNF